MLSKKYSESIIPILLIIFPAVVYGVANLSLDFILDFKYSTSRFTFLFLYIIFFFMYKIWFFIPFYIGYYFLFQVKFKSIKLIFRLVYGLVISLLIEFYSFKDDFSFYNGDLSKLKSLLVYALVGLSWVLFFERLINHRGKSSKLNINQSD